MATKQKPPRPSDDDRRIQAVCDLKILDTPREARFDRLTRELAQALEAPLAYIALIDGDRQWLKSKIGDIETEVERDQSFCTYTIMQEQPLVVNDATKDDRFAANPFVTGQPNLRFYAGVPIQDPHGQTVGTVCVADKTPRDMSPAELAVLKKFADRVEREINAKPSVFISYAHEDEHWKDRLEVHCAILKRQGLLSVWDDRQIKAGTDWHQNIREAAERAKAAVLLISADFLASDFIINDEVPLLFERRDAEGLEIFPLLLRPCAWQHVDWLARMNLRPKDGRPLSAGSEAEIEGDLSEFASEVARTIAEHGRALVPTPVPSKASRTWKATRPSSTAPSPAREVPSASLEPGSQLGRYEILSGLGSGGIGQVFLARDSNLKRKVAIKVLRPELASDPERLERFQREAETVAALNHPNIVTLFSVEEDRDVRFLTMELVEGKTLDKITPSRGLSLAKIFEIAVPLTEALAAAHNRGIVHRDLKATNVMVSEAGLVKVLDFGLAKLLDNDRTGAATDKLTHDGLAVGTIPYMSPEQVEGQPVDARSDIFSLGVMLYEMVTGRMPFEAKSSTGLVASILRDRPKPVSELRRRLPHELDGIIQRCLEKDPDKRFQSALDVRNALLQLESADDAEASTLVPPTKQSVAVPEAAPEPRPKPAPKPAPQPAPPSSEISPRKLTPIVAASAAAALLLIVGGIWMMRNGAESGPAERPSEPETVAPPAAAAVPSPEAPEPDQPSAAAVPASPDPQTQPPVQAPPPARATPVAKEPPAAKDPPKSRPDSAAVSAPPASSRSEPEAKSVAPPKQAPPPPIEEPPSAAPAPTDPVTGPAAKSEPAPAPPSDPRPPAQPVAPEPQAAEPAPDPKEPVLRTLADLERAYAALDADAISKLFPNGPPKDRLAKAFEGMKSQQLEIKGCQVSLIGDDGATATCTQKLSIIPKSGPAPPAHESNVVFTLRRQGGRWLIESLRQ